MTGAGAMLGAGASRRAIVSRVARAFAFGGGVFLAAWCVRSVGPERLAATIRAAGSWVPVVVALEVGMVLTDLLGVRALLGDAAHLVSRATWLRATLLAYGVGIVVPGGRAAGEAVRAATLARHVGVPRAARASASLQISVLYANTLASVGILAWFACVGLAAWRTAAGEGAAPQATLALALAGNALLCGAIGVALHALAANARFVRWLRAVTARFIDATGTDGSTRARAAADGEDDGRGRRGPLSVGVLFCFLGRVVQTVQYGVIVYAVGGSATATAALTAQGIHLVGATAGDAIPSQLGATEGAFQLFAGTLGLGAAPERAVAIALVVRVAQLGLALLAFAVAALVGRSAREEPG
ncbi:MAG: hypothetical protein QOI41_1830 [Myxococcales bacterium]|nr:hypothetical protein [Myxococcales bacterium]